MLLLLFCVIEWKRGDEAVIPPRLLKQKTILGSALVSAFLSVALQM
jgi:hypothetical protein